MIRSISHLHADSEHIGRSDGEHVLTGQNEPALGVRVVDLNGLAVHRVYATDWISDMNIRLCITRDSHVSRLVRSGTRHVLRERGEHDEVNADTKV